MPEPLICLSDSIYIENLDSKYQNELKVKFTYRNPTYDPRNIGDEFFIRSYEEIPNGIRLTRGCFRYLKSYLSKHGVHSFIIDDRRSLPLIDVSLNFTLRDYQERVRDILIEKTQGVFVAPCGSGKTSILLSTIPVHRQPTLIVVHTTELMTQWIKEIKTKLKPKFRVGQIGDTESSIGPITVGLVQSLIRWEKWDELNSRFGCVILDEAHHCPAMTFNNVINRFSAKYRFGASATPYRKDKKEMLMFDTIGEILDEITDSELEKSKHITSCKVKVVETNFYSNIGKWVYLINKIVNDSGRNAFILQNIMRDVEENKKVLVLSDRRDHCKLLHNFLDKKGIRVKLLLGGTTSKYDRDERKKIFRDPNIQVVVATTNIAKEGLDKPDLASIHMTCPSNNKGAVKQICGRVRRIHLTKIETPIVYDYCDWKVGMLYTMYCNRRAWYNEWGFEIEEQKDGR